MRDYVMEAARRGFAVRIHAIGDEAITQAIDIFEEVNARFGAPAIGHHCIEHLENMKEPDVARLAKAGIVAVNQPPHITLDPGGPERDLGDERCKVMWPFASFLHEGDARVRHRFARRRRESVVGHLYGCHQARCENARAEGWVACERAHFRRRCDSRLHGRGRRFRRT